MHEDAWRGSLDAWKTTEPDPYPGIRHEPCDHCGDRWGTQEVGPFRAWLCDRCAEQEIR